MISDTIIYDTDGKEITLTKPFSIIIIRCSFYDDTLIIYGETGDIKKYWDSLDDFDYNWFQFDIEESIKCFIEEKIKETPWSGDWKIHNIKDLNYGKYPDDK